MAAVGPANPGQAPAEPSAPSPPPSAIEAGSPKRKGRRSVFDASARRHIARLARTELRRHVPTLILAVILMALVASSTAGLTFVIETVLDDVFTEKNEAMLPIVAAALLGLGVVKGGATYAHSVVMNRVGMRIVTELQQKMFDHVLAADLSFFTRMSPGALISRFTNDLQMLRAALQNCVIGLGRDVVAVIGLTGAMFWHDWLLACFAFVVIPVAVLPISRMARRMRKAATGLQEQSGRLTTLLDEAIRGARQVKAFGMENFESRRFRAAAEETLERQLKVVRTRSLAAPLMELLTGIGIAAVIVYGGSRVIAGEIQIGAFVAFLAAAMLAYQPVKSLANLVTHLQEGVASLERVYSFMDSRPQIIDRPGATALRLGHDGGPAIRLDGVEFAYGEDAPVLRGLSLTIPANAKAALVGPSGAGKSTILNLIPRFYEVAAGQVTIDGTDIRDVTLASLRAHIAMVTQDVVLFDDTVRANIAYGRPGASMAEIEAAARAARAHDFILALPEGYDTEVGPRGTRLSGGQAQRVSIARAVLKDAPILLLDEATSSLDTASERHIQLALRELMRGRTTLVIAHRLSTVMDADVIFVIEAGQVAEAGTHAELLALGGHYARLYALQLQTETEAA